MFTRLPFLPACLGKCQRMCRGGHQRCQRTGWGGCYPLSTTHNDSSVSGGMRPPAWSGCFRLVPFKILTLNSPCTQMKRSWQARGFCMDIRPGGACPLASRILPEYIFGDVRLTQSRVVACMTSLGGSQPSPWLFSFLVFSGVFHVAH